MRSKLKLLLVAGARPNFMKIAPVIREIDKRSHEFEHKLVHTGQHYDEGMSDIFFSDLGIPQPDYHLNVGSASHARQTAAIMVEFEPVLERESPDCVLVFGDVNSTLACSIVAKKMNFPVAHVEAGLRSRDMEMPEEINRIVTDSITDYFFVTEEAGMANLRAEGQPDSAAFHVGHVMVDNLLYEIMRLEAEQGSESMDARGRFGVAGKPFGVVTMHRPSNVDDPDTLAGIVRALSTISEAAPLVFPVHPRTSARLKAFGLEFADTVKMTAPLGYHEFLDLWRHASIVLTDSGGMQEETTALGIPCLTLRANTERPVTVSEGTNKLVGSDPETVIREARALLARDFDNTNPRRPKF